MKRIIKKALLLIVVLIIYLFVRPFPYEPEKDGTKYYKSNVSLYLFKNKLHKKCRVYNESFVIKITPTEILIGSTDSRTYNIKLTDIKLEEENIFIGNTYSAYKRMHNDGLHCMVRFARRGFTLRPYLFIQRNMATDAISLSNEIDKEEFEKIIKSKKLNLKKI